ncbi:Clavaminate synthase-like protein [Cucurbitaria berberidis CBS 394.84]|uniref:Clavaminate synthase-like protein n=1 Tax=Cucurbitaria berberidis CBS 394.84 TaxID=1168544 RepID=A0A9P4GPW8_9PLEO|nr:Clavaminate synthase-like protein [Cucurbitaria berberidis CBS 394.84]KAF1849159.1 Clavaminate synthase-like protein [Cucurbitaria berberidis CBS 394.84]
MPHSDISPLPCRELFSDLPPFPDNIPTAPLLRISLEKLLQHDSEEEERCWKACCDLGFFYLDLHTSSPISLDDKNRTASGETLLQDADQLFEVMKGFYDLDIKEKIKYDFKDQGSYFGYKGYGEGFIDKQGTRDRNEFYNISKDDILGLSPPLPSPAVLNPHRALYKSYIHSSHAVCMLIASLISLRLPLTHESRAAGGLPALHNLRARSGDQIRFVKAPPQEPSLRGVALGEHTDFGSVTVLFNRLGGLQVRLPPSIAPAPARPSSSSSPPLAAASDVERRLCEDGWAYVRPLPRHCIVNLGDALVKFSNGLLRSNIHRVVAPPGGQGGVTRYSLVYFCRPEDDVLLKGVVEGEEGEGKEVVTAKEWILRRALGRRKVDGWAGSGGTEGVSMRGGGMRV